MARPLALALALLLSGLALLLGSLVPGAEAARQGPQFTVVQADKSNINVNKKKDNNTGSAEEDLITYLPGWEGPLPGGRHYSGYINVGKGGKRRECPVSRALALGSESGN